MTATADGGLGDTGASTGCGDGVVTAGEGCDDHDVVPGDGCSVACAIEPGWRCTGEPSTCVRAMESCDAPATGPADEDADGLVDEDCGFYADTLHAVADIDVQFAIEPIGPAPLEVYLGTYESSTTGIMRASRPSVGARFEAPTPFETISLPIQMR